MSDNFKEVLCSITILLCVTLVICFIIYIPTLERFTNDREIDCYDFYQENGYILDYCNKYKDKLENSNK